MRGAMLWATALLVALGAMLPARVAMARQHVAVAVPAPPPFSVGTLTFEIPPKWLTEPAATPARGGQWRVAPMRGEGEGGELVVFYFGPGVGGTPKENVEAWIGTMFDAEGHPAGAEVKHHETNGFKITQVVIFGTYNMSVPLPGVPPMPRSNYGLLGAVIESAQGNIYWRFTGPEALITANLPLFNKIIDSVRPGGK